MKKICLSSCIVLFALCGCSSKDQQFCDCISASKQLNSFTTKALNQTLTQKELAEAKRLKSNKIRICKDFQTMSGPQMLEKQKECN